MFSSSGARAPQVHVMRPQAAAAAGRVKGVGLEPVTVIVLSRGRHDDPVVISSRFAP